jgi:hypothetical protein
LRTSGAIGQGAEGVALTNGDSYGAALRLEIRNYYGGFVVYPLNVSLVPKERAINRMDLSYPFTFTERGV